MKLGLIAGNGRFPLLVLDAARQLGHDVTVVCQERHPERYDLGGARVVVPDLPGRLLPVFVLDRYEGLEARLLVDMSPEEQSAFVAANAT